MTLTRDARAYAVAVKAALASAATAGSYTLPAYERDEFPNTLPSVFLVVSVSRRYIETLRAAGYYPTNGWRVTIDAVGTTVDEARWATWRATQALEEQSLTVAGSPTTGLIFETDDDVHPDGDDVAKSRFVNTTTLTFIH